FSRASFPNLRALDLNHNHLEGGLSAFADTDVSATLRWLDVRGCAASLDDVIAFARTARMPALQSLSLGNTDAPLTARALQALGPAEGLPRLRWLHIDLPGSVKLYEALAQTPLLSRVSHLQLGRGTVSAKCVAVLTSSPGFQHLRSLRFWASSINGTNHARLKEHFGERFVD